MKRAFYFGCSYTKFHWLTWADILTTLLGEYGYTSYNYGMPGGSNQYIFQSIIEANAKHKFSNDDLIFVCFTGFHRFNIYRKNEWIAQPNGLKNTERSQDHHDNKGSILQDFSFFQAVIDLSKMYRGKFYFNKMSELEVHFHRVDLATKINLRLMYDEVFKTIGPSVDKTVKDCPVSPVREKIDDFHPTPDQHLWYVEKMFPQYPVTDKVRKMIDDECERLLKE